MQFFSFGINHHQVSVDQRGKFSCTESMIREIYRAAELSEHAEYVILSTCNRSEVILYGTQEDVQELQEVISSVTGAAWPEEAFEYKDEPAIKHLLAVTAGLDSMVLGDAQILNQVKEAYRLAVDEEKVGAVLHRLMHTAFSGAKRVVTETSMAGGSASVAGTAVQIAYRASQALKNGDALTCLVLGAGQMGKLVVEALSRESDVEILVANRSKVRAEQLVEMYAGAKLIDWENRHETVATADIVVVASGATEYVLIADQIPAPESGHQVLIVDISVPRCVDPSIKLLDGYRLYDMDDLQAKIQGVISDRKEALPLAREICDQMLADFVSWCFHHQAMQPAIHAILDTFDNIRLQEIERHAHRFEDADLKQLDRITKSIMQKVLAVPVVRLKNVGPDHIDYVNGVKLLQTLFARTSCEEPDLLQFDHTEQMLDAIAQPENISLSTLAACPFDEEEASSRANGATQPLPSESPFVLGTRGSALALWQANHVQDLLERAGYDVVQERITTRGDQILDKPLALIEGKSLFTKELDVALVEGRIDLAVHSLKDLPSELPPGLVLAAISPRENPFDAFVAHPSFDGTLEDLPQGAIIGTSSLRRTAQLKAWRPDLQVVPIRGNVDTRLAKLDKSEWHGIILAAAGLIRIGQADRIHTVFDRSIMLPAVGQGALGIVCAESNGTMAEILRTTLHDEKAAAAVLSERAFLNCLEGSCHVPVGGFAEWENDELILYGLVASMDGTEVVKGHEVVDPDAPQEAGVRLAHRLLAEGAGEILHLVKL